MGRGRNSAASAIRQGRASPIHRDKNLDRKRSSGSASQHAERRRNAERVPLKDERPTAPTKREQKTAKIEAGLKAHREVKARQAERARVKQQKERAKAKAKKAKERSRAKKAERKAANAKRAKLFSDVAKTAKRAGAHEAAHHLRKAAQRLRKRAR